MTARTQVRIFTVLAVAEAISWAGLLTGMYFKYFTAAGEFGVQVFGPIHGVIFIAYALATLSLARTLRWSKGTTVFALMCSVPPFTTVLFELWALRAGRLTARYHDRNGTRSNAIATAMPTGEDLGSAPPTRAWAGSKPT